MIEEMIVNIHKIEEMTDFLGMKIIEILIILIVIDHLNNLIKDIRIKMISENKSLIIITKIFLKIIDHMIEINIMNHHKMKVILNFYQGIGHD
jgi:phage-related holin